MGLIENRLEMSGSLGKVAKQFPRGGSTEPWNGGEKVEASTLQLLILVLDVHEQRD